MARTQSMNLLLQDRLEHNKNIVKEKYIRIVDQFEFPLLVRKQNL
jgi:hypothetical protein